MRSGAMPARSSALRAASAARPLVVLPMRRSLMPVRSVIHSSLVSMVAARSSFVTILSGTAIPHPRTTRPRTPSGTRGTSGRPEPGDRLAAADSFAVDGDERLEDALERRTHLVFADAPEDCARPDGRAA